MKIILATDGSDPSNAAAEAVENRSFPNGSEVLMFQLLKCCITCGLSDENN